MNKLLFFIIIITLTYSCNNYREKSRIKDELKSKIGRKLDLPCISANNNEHKFKIVSFVNGECPSCVEKLYLWEKFLLKINNKNSLLFIIYLHSSNIDYLKKYYGLLSNPLVTVIDDESKTFYRNNHLSDNAMFHTFITNHSNEILLVGNPVFNRNIETLYLKLINNDIIEQKIAEP